ncbi:MULTISPECIES: preprotein translocase subunit SecY [Acidiphilium]|jgi:preprotein translocase subunit SecY|uniref:Protein translocase subunit SecY n=1 Tax=Acidiphilium rubrum TaxID=526 RepID=A0A8G2CIA2_ACIRU|nr:MULTISPECIES: preprotein translocase subunit SecY [Acidiphilium]MBW4034680.1 preprotein translocase subunit SecY [Pseudomonadota bacterium]OYW03886.1 MAG: preprotein translocase subunit SecY [Acidiphilium sp. 37-64-53]OZB29604.1 MAG: preprotein translocase subunit SecY [Acidiphilium sp. 34-64-41]SIQ21711.1 protein translocase subunit secY/sec61 alpha [Acidiphilium rubrum]HQT83811.1 preprotein translocase subunit SecY [Acidiphilium rubrum]
MASAAEQLASSFNLETLSKATDLKRRIWFTLGALIVFRLGTYIPIPGVDPTVMEHMLAQNGGGVLGMFNMFTGGALGRMTVFALNIMPYISASIIMQLLQAAVPTLETLKKEGASGQQKLNQYTRYLTVFIALAQSYGIALGLEHITSAVGPAVIEPGGFFLVTTIITLTGGTVFLMWIGEQITSRGIGNGSSLIIFSGIVSAFPGAIASVLQLGATGGLSTGFVIGFFIMALVVVAFVVFMERAQRRVLIQYPKRQVGNRMFGGDASHLPMKVNTSGVIPPIFASSLLLIPATIVGFSHGTGPAWLQFLARQLSNGQPGYMILYAGLIIFFSYFYTAVVFNPEETADNLKKYGGFVPGIRPGANTAKYFDTVLTRLTTIGAGYLVIVCLIPQFLIGQFDLAAGYYFGGTSLLIVVSVTMDTVAQIQSHLLAHQYEGLIRKGRGRTRTR